MKDIELALFLIVLVPLVLLLPDEAHDFKGSCSHIDGGTGGDMTITAGLDSFDIDANRSLTAEPGTQFVVLELPDTMSGVDVKPMFAARGYGERFVLFTTAAMRNRYGGGAVCD